MNHRPLPTGCSYDLFRAWGGWISVVAGESGLVQIALPTSRQQAARAAGPARLDAAHPLLARARSQILEYLAGDRREFDLPTSLDGLTPFTQAVLKATAGIPYGETVTYREVATAAGSPRGARAAGQALHHNPLPLVIPCHRVLGAQRQLTGFGGGLDMKRNLLMMEALAGGAPRPWRE